MNSNRTGSSQVRFIAAAVFCAMLGTGYAISTSGGAEADSRIAIPAVPAVTESLTYFPAQYVNQATAAEDHIQSF